MKAVPAGALLLAAACAAPGEEAALRELGPGVEAIAWTGEPLARIVPESPARERFERELAAARARWEAGGAEDDAIWVGRHLAYLGRYREAIRWCGERLEDFPASVRLRRHRGHRFLSVREVDRAVADLEEAWELARGTGDELEPDGLPNALGLPRSTTHTNVLYHLALARWLRGEHGAAADLWLACGERSPNDDMRVASWSWAVHALRRAGREVEAAALLERVSPEMDVIENHAYHRLLLLQKGLLAEEDLLGAAGDDGVQDATVLYGVSLWRLASGDPAGAEALWRRTVGTTPWNAFGHLGAESELASAAG